MKIRPETALQRTNDRTSRSGIRWGAVYMTTHHSIAGNLAGPQRAAVELLTVKQTAKLLNASPRTVYRLSDAGKMPRPVKLGALVRWRADELRQWIAEGCPKVRTLKGGVN